MSDFTELEVSVKTDGKLISTVKFSVTNLEILQNVKPDALIALLEARYGLARQEIWRSVYEDLSEYKPLVARK